MVIGCSASATDQARCLNTPVLSPMLNRAPLKSAALAFGNRVAVQEWMW